MMYYDSYAYGGYYDVNSIYLLLLVPILALSVWAQFQVSGNFQKYSRVRCGRGMTGAQAAEAVLRAHHVYGVGIRPCSGSLTDHYDPRDNCIYLSDPVYGAATVAAVGVACHEAGHAVQYAENYAPVRIRSAVIPATQFGSRFSFIALALGIMLFNQSLLLVGIVLFSLTTFFQLVTLPVEFDASRRSIQTIEGQRFLTEEETRGAKKVLRAAALTYVAALLMSALQLMRYVLIFMSRNNRRRN